MKRIFRYFFFIAILLLGTQSLHATVLGANTSEQPPSCPGAFDGWVTIDSLTVIPPSGPYVIRINTSPVRFFNVGDTVFGLTNRNYIITVLDLSDNSVNFTPVNFASAGINIAAFSNPASCFGVCDGNANVAVIGGIPPYSFQWDDPSNQNTQLATNLCGGIQYRVTVTDNNGCTQVDSVIVGQPPQIFPNVAVTDVSCFGSTDGAAVSNPSGGSGVFVNWAWSSSGNNTNSEGPLAPGPYSVTVTDSDGCTGVENFTVGQPGALNALFAVTDNPCFNGNVGAITTTVNGGTPNFNFVWDDGPLTQNRSNLVAGTYTVTITDNNGCILVDSATVGEASEILFNLSVNSNNNCFGDSTGSVTANYSGGTPPYTFLWSESSSGSGNSSTINNLAAGTYTITVTDNNGCTAEDSISVTEPSQIQIAVANFANPACNGDANGLIDLNVSGGTPPLTFNWSPSGNTEDLFGIGAGNYSLTVTDGNSCTAVFDTTLVDPPALSFVFDSISNVSCNGLNDGFLRVLASGGTGAYSYNWDPAGNTPSISNLTAGTYKITVSDINGCTAVDSATITEPSPLSVTTSSTDASCFGDNDGTASSNPSGGTPPYTFSWAPGGQTTQNISNLIAGTYTITVSDLNGCTATSSTTVGEPTDLTVSITGSNLNCNGDATGVALANVLGGSPAYTFSWSDPLNQTTNPATSLAAGTYTVTVTDLNGCTAIDSVTLTEPAILDPTLNTYDVSCGGLNDGAAAVNVSGGAIPYNFAWGPGNPIGQGTDSISNLTPGNYSLTITDNNACDTVLNFTINQLPPTFTLSDSSVNPLCNGDNTGFIGIQISGGAAPFNFNWNPPLPNQANQPNLVAGTYAVTVTDNNGCADSTSIILNQPSAVTVSDSIVDESCAPGGDGEIFLTVNGGTPGYNYNWNPALSNSPSQTGLAAGTYDVTITDLNGCVENRSYTVNTQTPAFTVTLIALDVSCNGLSDGSVLANAIPVGTNYRYTWADIGVGASLRGALPTGTYTVTVTDTISGCTVVDSATVSEPSAIQSNLTLTPTGCAGPGIGSVVSNPTGGDGGPFGFLWNTPGGNVSGNTVTNLAAGSYDVTITDNSGCTLVDTFLINTNPSNIDPNAVVNDASCNGLCDGTINLSPSNGLAPYSLLWNDADTSRNRTGLCAGNYTVTITGADNCDTTISLTVGEPAAISAAINTTNDTCAAGLGGARVSSVSNGTPPFTYNWPSSGTSVGDSVNSLTTGNYDLTITDNGGCQAIIPFTIGNVATFSVGLDSTDVSCSGGNDGTITSNLSGGVPPFNYSWTGGLSGPNPINVSAGTYSVTVTDGNGCGAVASVTVNQPVPLQLVNLITYPENCNPGNDGAARVFFSGGTPPYTYSWPASGTAVGDSVNSLTAGSYTLTITDANACDTTINFTINSNPNYTVVVNTTDISCNGLTDGLINLTVSLAVPPITFNWSDIGNGPSNRSGLGQGIYSVTITDGSGCTTVETDTINEPAVLEANTSSTDETCTPGGDGTASTAVTGGTGPYNYSWSPGGATTPGITGLTPGTYFVTVTDINGCSVVDSAIVNSGANILLNETVTQPTCNGGCDGDITLSPSGGTAPYTYLWDDNSTQFFRLGLCAGSYDVTVTDNASCQAIRTIVVGEPDSILSNATVVNESCNPGGDGSISTAVTGGTGPYTYLWSFGAATSPGIGPLSAGSYTVTITDSENCTLIDTINVGTDPSFAVTAVINDPSCPTATDGSIDQTISGSIGTLVFAWDNGLAPTEDQSNLGVGTYKVTITDQGNGCVDSATYVLNPSSNILGNIVGEDQRCGNTLPCDGKAFVTPSGGTAPYTYNWTLGVVTGLSPDTAINLCNGQYFVTITDANGCTGVDSVIINSPTPIDTSFSAINATCNNCDGSLKVTPNGGTSPYNFVWTDASANQIGTTDSIGNLCAGLYTVQITDNQGCSATFTRSISDDGAESLSTSKTDVSCFNGNDGQATVNFVCNDPACSIAWFDALGQPLNITTATASNLSAGTYFVEVTNNSGCVSLESVVINQPNVLSASISGTAVSCNSNCDGTANVLVSGGTAPYQFNWSPAPGGGQGTANVTGLCATNYSVTITDNNGCDTTISINIGSPAALTASFTVIDAGCGLANGSISAIVSGGTVSLDYQYQWFDAANNPIVGQNSATINNIAAGAYILEVTDDNNCLESFNVVLNNSNGPTVSVDSITNIICSGSNTGEIFISVSGLNDPFTYNWLNQGQTTEDISNLSAGTYTVIVTDTLGCIGTDTATVLAPSAILASVNAQDATCGQCNGIAGISVNGGTAPYTYLWSNGSTVDTTAGLCAGVHSVVVTDANGCTESFNFTINTLEGPSDAIVNATNESCFGASDGSVTVTPVGGTAPYNYQWLHNGATTNSLSNLSSGTYFLLITDSAGCSRNVEVNIGSPNELVLTPIVTASTCASINCDGSIRLNVSGGNQPYAYNWQFAPTADTSFLDGLCAGIYEVTVTDANGCSKTINVPLPNNGNPVVANPSVSDVSCNGSCDGSLISNLTPSATLTYRWLNENGTGIAPIDSDLLNAACAGEYILEVTTLPEGCITYASVQIKEPDTILLGASIVKNISCNGVCDGEVFVSTIGGSILFSYAWDDPSAQTGSLATNLCAGTYSVTATDANGCTATTSVTLDNPPPINLSINSQSILNCSSDCNASADISASGGTAPYTFSWDGGQSGSNPTTLCFGPNILTVTDATGCSEQITVNIAAVDTVVAQVPSDTLFCEGDSVRLIGTTNASTVNSFAWYLEDTTTVLTSSADTSLLLAPGDYTFFFIISNGGCSDTAIYRPTIIASPAIQLPAEIDIYKDMMITIRINGEDPSYLFNWTPAEGLDDSTIAEPTVSIEESRTYVLTVTDTNGCNYIDSVEVVFNDELDVPSGFTPNGDGKNDVWEISVLEEFPDAKVQIFNRWGELLFEQDNGYKIPWDGTYEGSALPIGTYYYIIDVKDDRFKTLTGPITLLR
jgi:gliding motility-associated-like protein